MKRPSKTAPQRAFSAMTLLFWIAVFLIPCTLFVTGLYLKGVEPFGDASYLNGDMRLQYADFAMWFKSVLLDGQSLMYSPELSLGTNTWGLYSYYLASPFNLLVVFFADEQIGLFFALTTMIKVGCIGLAVAYYLRKRFNLRRGFVLLLIPSFAWSLWVIYEINNPMWLDGLIFMPFLLYGIYSLVRTGKGKVHIVAAGCALIISCWYIAYMVILFSLFFLVFELIICHIEDEGALSKKVVAKRIFTYIGLLATVLLLSSFSFLPTVSAMLEGSSRGSYLQVLLDFAASILGSLVAKIASLGLPAQIVLALVCLAAVYGCIRFFRTKNLKGLAKAAIVTTVFLAVLFVLLYTKGYKYFDLETLFTGVFVGSSFPHTATDIIELYCGMLVMVLAVLFFFAKAVPRGVKIVAALFLVFMIMSMMFSYLYVIWCGFKMPYSFYCRIAFLFSFLAMFLAAYALQKLQVGQIRQKEVIASAAVVLIWACLVLGVLGLPGGYNTWQTFAVIIALTAVYGAILSLLAQDGRIPLDSKLCAVMLAVLLACVIGDGIYASHLIWSNRHVGYSASEHVRYVLESKEQLAELKTFDDSVYRADKTHTRVNEAALNEGLALGYGQLSSYASAQDIEAINFLCSLGYSAEGEFSVKYDEPILLTDALLGVKYAATEEQPLGYKDIGLANANTPAKSTTIHSGSRFYQNPYALSLGYEVDSLVLDATLKKYDNPFERQNALVSSLQGHETVCYVEAEAELVLSEQGILQWEVAIPEGAIGYAYVMSKPGDSSVKLWLALDDGEPFGEDWRFGHSIRAINTSLEAEGTHTVTLTSESSPDELGAYAEFPRDTTCVFYYLNVDTALDALANLGEEQFFPHTFEDGLIAGVYQATEDGLLMLTVPYDDGWKLKVNNAEVELKTAFDDTFMVIPVAAGDNEIVLTYVSPGLVSGTVITLVTAITLAILLARRRVVLSRGLSPKKDTCK